MVVYTALDVLSKAATHTHTTRRAHAVQQQARAGPTPPSAAIGPAGSRTWAPQRPYRRVRGPARYTRPGPGLQDSGRRAGSLVSNALRRGDTATVTRLSNAGRAGRGSL